MVKQKDLSEHCDANEYKYHGRMFLTSFFMQVQLSVITAYALVLTNQEKNKSVPILVL